MNDVEYDFLEQLGKMVDCDYDWELSIKTAEKRTIESHKTQRPFIQVLVRKYKGGEYEKKTN